MEIQIIEVETITPPMMELLILADPSPEVIQTYIDLSKKIVAMYQGQPIGIAALLDTRPKCCEIMAIAVSENHQRQGIGKQLIEHCIDNAKKRGKKIIEIGTGNPGIYQMYLYQKCGFRIVGIDFDYFTQNYPEEIVENGIVCRDMIRMRHFLS